MIRRAHATVPRLSPAPEQPPLRWGRVVWLGVVGMATVACVVGATPALLAALAIAAWTRRLAPRWGGGGAVSLATVIGAAALFLILVLTPATPAPFQVGVIVALGIGAAVPALLQWRSPMGSITADQRWILAGSSLGGAVWLAALGVAQMLPGSSARSWGVLDDSTLDLFIMRDFADYNGFPVLSNGNPRPLEHALSTAMLALGTPLDSGGTEMAAEISAHSAHWTLSIVIGCALSGTVASVLAGTASRGPGHVRSVAVAGLASIGLLAGPATGFFLVRGQINGSLVVTLVMASIMLATQVTRDPVKGLAGLVAAMTLLMISWTPFAAVPGLLAVVGAIRHRRAIAAGVRDRGRRSLIPLAAASVFFLWCLAVISSQEILTLASAGDEARYDRITAASMLSAPYSIPGTVAMLALIVALSAVTLRGRRELAFTVSAAVIALVLGFVPLLAARGHLGGALEYYPSRYLHMATLCLVPIAVGLVAHALRADQPWWAIAIALAGPMTVLALLVSTPIDTRVERWRPVPVLLLAGDYYGPDEYVHDRIVDFADESPGVRLPWNLEIPWDQRVRFMLSIDDSDRFYAFFTWERVSLRNRQDDAVDRLCLIAAAHDKPVTIVTADPGLEEIARSLCTPGRLDKMTFEVVPATS